MATMLRLLALVVLAATAANAQPFTSSAYGTIVNWNVQQPPFYYNPAVGYTDANNNPTGFLSIDQLLCKYTPAPYDANQVNYASNFLASKSTPSATVNPVPIGTMFQGVVSYTSTKTHTILQDPFYPFSAIWVYCSACIGQANGVNYGQLVQIKLLKAASLTISGNSTFTNNYFGNGVGGAYDQTGYTITQDNIWVLITGQALGKTQATVPNGGTCVPAANGTGCGFAAPNNVGAFGEIKPTALAQTMPGLTINQSALSYAWLPSGYSWKCSSPSGFSGLNATESPTTTLQGRVNTLLAPPPPALKTAPPTFTLPSNCMTVAQFLCQYTQGSNILSTYFTAPVTLCGVTFYATSTGNQYIQDPFPPYSSVWMISDNGVMANNATPHSLLMTAADPTKVEYVGFAIQRGYLPGTYLQFSMQNATIAYTGASSALPMFTVSGITWALPYQTATPPTCDWRNPSTTLTSCPPTNCQLATCGQPVYPSGVAAPFTSFALLNPTGTNLEHQGINTTSGAADYCIQARANPSYANQLFLTRANTLNCPVQLLSEVGAFPYLGPPFPNNAPLTNTGATQCSNYSLPAGLQASPSAMVYVVSTTLINGYTVASFGQTQANYFLAAVASVLSVPVSNTSIVNTAATQPATALSGRRHLLQNQVYVTFQVGTPYSNSAQLVTSIAQNTIGQTFITALNNNRLTGVTSATSGGFFPQISLQQQAVAFYSTTTGCLGQSTSNGCKGAIAGLVIGLSLFTFCVLGLLYRFVLKKKNIEAGQKSAVMMTPVAAPEKV